MSTDPTVRRINRATFVMVFVGASAILFGIVLFSILVFREPDIPMVDGDGEEFSLSIDIAKEGPGCASDLMSRRCVEFWSSRGVPREDLRELRDIENRRAALVGFAFIPIFVITVVAQVRRHHDCGRSGWFVLLNIIPCVGLVAVGFLLFEEGKPMPNKYGPPPRRGIAWPILWFGRARAADGT